MQLWKTPWQQAPGVALNMGNVGVVDAAACRALDLAADRAGRTAKAFSNRSDGARIVAHGHDNGALLGGQMFVDFRHGGTLQERCCTWSLRTPLFTKQSEPRTDHA